MPGLSSLATRDGLWLFGTSAWMRVVAWLAIVGATGVLTRAEVTRPQTPPGVRVFQDLVFKEVEGRRLRLDVYVSEAAELRGERRPVILAIHGGGWRGGPRTTTARRSRNSPGMDLSSSRSITAYPGPAFRAGRGISTTSATRCDGYAAIRLILGSTRIGSPPWGRRPAATSR